MPDELLDKLSVEERTAQWKERLADPSDPYHRVIVAESNGSIVSFASYGYNLEPDSLYRDEIYALYILNELGENICMKSQVLSAEYC